MFAQPLISAEQLLALQRSCEPVVLLDTRFDLAKVDAGQKDWRAGHLPGSVYLHLDTDLSGSKTGRNGRHPLPDRADFAATLGRAGITPLSLVVTLDAQGGMYAARAWWMLRWMGHDKVAVLDGGIKAWLDAGGTLSAEGPQTAATPPYPQRPALVGTRDAPGLAAGLGRVALIDARAPERFRGDVEPLDAQAGHIPGALNRFFRDNLTQEGHFKPPEQLRREFLPFLGDRGAEQVVHQCGSGVTACHNLLAMEHAGLTGSTLYPGSWSEWSSDPARPVARG
ncbi:MAG: sulfurtransferase [Burkholderiaceae bacterium]